MHMLGLELLQSLNSNWLEIKKIHAWFRIASMPIRETKQTGKKKKKKQILNKNTEICWDQLHKLAFPSQTAYPTGVISLASIVRK